MNTVSEHFIEAANATSINAPYGVSEWSLTGLHPAPCTFVKAPRVKESVFATECRLVEVKEWESRAHPGKKSGVTVILEGINFWVREDAINVDRNMIDLEVYNLPYTGVAFADSHSQILRPMSRLGGISYARTVEGIELLRPNYDKVVAEGHVKL